ncbi:YihY/virulence factor BrkB family protein [Arthrobacter halodurans]|uniref:YihY/virulence factor BrkB family protein n=1 Tax=Arthrobacter halodurans TaxID=516699 RepID=A0ABV4UTJ8_9MICC
MAGTGRRTTSTTPSRGAVGSAAGSSAVVAAAASSGTDPAEPVDPLDRAELRAEAIRKRAAWGKTRREKAGPVAEALAAGGWFMARMGSRRPFRALRLYLLRHGPLLAAGIAYNLFFSVAAMLVVGFSILGLIVSGNTELQEIIVAFVARTVPGLIDTGEGGLAQPEDLFDASAFGWSLVISTAAMLITSLGWIAGLRTGMRGIFGIPPETTNPVLAKVRDLGVLALLAVSLIITTVLALAVGTALDWVTGLLRLDSALAAPLARAGGIAVMLVLDAAVAVVLFRLGSGIRMPRRVMFQAAVLAAVGSTVLRFFSSSLLGSVSRNPLLASFAVVLGLFVWFYLLSQVYLLATAWGAVGTADAAARDGAATTGGGLRRRAMRMRRSARAAKSREPAGAADWPPGT